MTIPQRRKAMRAAVVFIALASLVGCVSIDRSPSNGQVVNKELDVERMMRSVPLVLYGGYAGAGVLFKSGDRVGLITAAHLIADSQDTDDPKTTYGTKTISVIGFKPATETVEYGVHAKLITLDPKHDWALLEVDCIADGMRFAEFSDRLPQIGNTVWAVGSPMFDAGTLTKGIVSHPDRVPAIAHDQMIRYIHSDLMCAEGNSGGGLFDDRGVCIGIVMRKHPINSTTYSFSTYYINEDLNSALLGPPDLMPKFID
jgi:S1-C subfamily serine protease